MTAVTAGTHGTKKAKYAASPSDLPNMETSGAMREIAGKGVADAKEVHEEAKVAAEPATGLLKNTFTTVTKGAADYNLKVLEIARTNTSAAFDYAQEMLGVKSLPEFVEVSTAHALKRFEAMTSQSKELTELAVKLTAEIAEPLKTGMTKAFDTQAARS